MDKVVVAISVEARNKLRELAKRHCRSMGRQLEFMINSNTDFPDLPAHGDYMGETIEGVDEGRSFEDLHKEWLRTPKDRLSYEFLNDLLKKTPEDHSDYEEILADMSGCVVRR